MEAWGSENLGSALWELSAEAIYEQDQDDDDSAWDNYSEIERQYADRECIFAAYASNQNVWLELSEPDLEEDIGIFDYLWQDADYP